MSILVEATPAAAAAAAVARIAAIAEAKPALVLGLATGSSPQPLYRALAASGIDLRRAHGFALDEYVGLPATDPQSYHAVIEREVTTPLGLDPSQVHVPDGTGPIPDVDAAALRYDHAIGAAGGVDVQILGIGSNGHIGFNEPGSSFDSRTRRVALRPETRRANSRFFPDLHHVPREAVTQGLGTIFAARSIVLMAHGEAKASAVARAVDGPITPSCPASLLQRHPDALFCLDAAAASRIRSRPVARIA